MIVCSAMCFPLRLRSNISFEALLDLVLFHTPGRLITPSTPHSGQFHHQLNIEPSLLNHQMLFKYQLGVRHHGCKDGEVLIFASSLDHEAGMGFWFLNICLPQRCLFKVDRIELDSPKYSALSVGNLQEMGSK